MKFVFSSFLILFFFVNAANSQNSNCACCTEKHAEFSFWEGEWNVTANGKPAGKNTLRYIQNKCVLEENWVSASPGYTGTSHSFYNTAKNQWEQIWVDNQGVSLHLKGHKNGNQMILETESATDSSGNSFVNRVTWTDNDDGSVRQLWEVITQTKDGKKNLLPLMVCI